VISTHTLVLHYRAMRWSWRLVLLVAVLMICAMILIAPNVDLQQTALRAMQWMQLFFALLTGLAMVLFYVSQCFRLFHNDLRSEARPLTTAPSVLSLRC